MELKWSNMMHSIVRHTVCYTWPVKATSWRNLSAVNTLQDPPVQCKVVKTLAAHCDSDVCSVPSGHSAGCRTSWFCLQHHATVVTSNRVTVCGSKFAPTVSKHCQHQHSAIHKTVQQNEVRNKPSCCDIQALLLQANIMAAFVHSHSKLFSDVIP
jgi:hypothetical protein